MATKLTTDMLIAAGQDDSAEAGITIRTDLEPLGGDGTLVKPATYEGGRFQHGRRWAGEGEDRHVVDVLVVDNEPSQANRLEAALEADKDTLGLPDIVLDLSAAGNLPPHLPQEISIYRFPHRNADAYLRDAMCGDVRFGASEIGRVIFEATAVRADALLAWCPQAPLFGFWQSHLGKRGNQSKKARSWTSEIIGIEPAADDIRRLGLKGDPLNLSVTEGVEVDDNNPEEWHLAAKGKRLATIGHGQVPVGGEGAALEGVSFRSIFQQATVSFASLRTVHTTNGSAEARAVLVVLGLVAHVSSFGRAFSLRSGADLRPRVMSWLWLGAEGDEELEVPDIEGVRALFHECVERAEAAGVPVGDTWKDHRLSVTPSPSLLDAIKKSWPVV